MFNSFNKSRSSFSNSTISNHGFSATDISVGNSSPITEEASDDYVSPASDFGSSSAASVSYSSPPQQGEDVYGSPGCAIISSDSGLLTGTGVSYSGATSLTGSAADDYGSPSGNILDSGSLGLSCC